MRTLAIAFCVSLIVVSCGPSALTYRDLSRLRKGMAKDSVENMLPIESKTSRAYSDLGYEIEGYPVLVAQVTQSSGGYYGAGGSYVSTSTTTSYNSMFYLIYENRQLRYWGMLGDLQKSEDVEIQTLAPKLSLVMK